MKFIPPIKEIYSSLKVRMKEYLLENTLHGVPYFVDRQRPKWERILWFILTMTSLGGALAIILTIWEKFQTAPTLTGLDPAVQDLQLTFPQVFVCYDWAQLNYSILEKSEQYVYEQLYKWSWRNDTIPEIRDPKYQKVNDFRSVFEMITPECSEIFTDCAFRNIRVPCKTAFSKVITAIGGCCKFNATRSMLVSDLPLMYAFETTIFPFKLYLMEKYDISPLPDDRPVVKVYTPTDVHFAIEVSLSTPDIRLLMLSQRECRYDDEEMSVTQCELNCLRDRILEKCQCLPWYLFKPDTEQCPMSRYQCVKGVAIDLSKCDCILMCNYQTYSTKRTVIMQNENQRTIISLMHWPRSVLYREMRFGYLDLLVSFGGIAGLFLGYSVLTSVELGYYFSLRAYCGAVVSTSRKKHNITTVHVIGAKSTKKLDVEPLYYHYID